MRGVTKLVGILVVLAFAAPIGAAAAAASSTQALVSAGLMRASDVPSTWQQSPQPDTGLAPLKKLTACDQYRALVAAARKNAFKLSPRFSDPSNGGSTAAEDVVYVFKNAATATKYVNAALTGNSLSCLQAFLERQVGNRGQVGPLTPITGLEGVGDQSVGYESDITVSGGTIVVDDIGVRVGRAFVAFTFQNPDATISEGPAIVNAVVNRLTQAGA